MLHVADLWRRIVAALTGTDTLTPGSAQEWLNHAADMGGDRISNYELYQEFYDGERGAKLRDRAQAYLQQSHSVPFSENFCDVTVDVLAERLEVVGFATSAAEESDGETVDPLAQLAEEWWAANRMDGSQSVSHTQALMKGDEFVIVEYDADAGRPTYCRQRQERIKVVYDDDDPDTIAWASKVWETTTVGPSNPDGARVRRLNVYFPDRLEKWFMPEGKGGSWSKWAEQDAPWPTPWVTRERDPIGVPVVHLRHRPLGDGNGRSRVRAAIPFQEQLNKYAADLNDLIDNHALPQWWATGVTNGDELLRVAGGMWTSSSETAQFGQLDPSDTDNILAAIEGVLSRLARRSRVPMHLLTGGTPPSGEALKTSEAGLVSTAKQCQREFGEAWEQLILMSLRIAATFSDGVPDMPADLRVIAQWGNPETRSDSDDLSVATQKKNLGVSQHTLLGELGYDAEREQELRTAEQAAHAEAQGALFDRGGLPV